MKFDSQTLMEKLSYLMFGGRDSELHVKGDKAFVRDSDIYSEVKLPGTFGGDFSFSLTKLLSIISRAPDKIDITLGDKNLLVKGKGLRAKVKVSKLTSEPVSERVSKWREIPEGFYPLFERLLMTSGKNIYGKETHLIYFSKNKGFSSDGLIATMVDFGDYDFGEIYVMNDVLSKILNIKPDKFAVTKKYIVFSKGDVKIFQRKYIPGDFPDVNAIFSQYKGNRYVRDFLISLDSVTRVEIFSDEKYKIPVLVTGDENGIVISSKGSIGSFKEKIKGDIFETFKFYVSSSLLKVAAGLQGNLYYDGSFCMLVSDNINLLFATMK